MKLWKPQSLASRISWLYGVSILLAATASLVLLTRQEFVRHIEDSQQSVKKMADLSVRQLSESAVIGDYDTIQRTLASLVPDSPLSQAVYLDVVGGRLQASRATLSAAPRWIVAAISAKLPDLSREIGFGGRKYGELTLRFDAEKIAADFWDLILKIVGFTVLALVFGLRLMYYLLGRWFRNLDRLAIYEKEVLSGAVNAQVPMTDDTPLEIRNTISVINRTAGSLRAQFGQRIESLMDSLIQHKNAMDEAAIVCELDTEGRLTYANNSFVEAIGLQREVLLQRRLVDIGAINLTAEDYWSPSPDTWHGEVLFESATGRQRWLRRSIVPNNGISGQIDRYICIDIDITDQKNSENDLRDEVRRQKLITDFGGLALVTQESHALEREVVQMARTGLQASHAALIVHTANAQQHVAAVVGWADEWAGQTLAAPAADPDGLAGAMFKALQTSGVLEVSAQASNGGRLSLLVADVQQGKFNAGHENYLRSLLHMLDAALERTRSREQLLYMAQFDGLTGLPNRAMLLDRLEVALQAARRQGTRLGLMYLDFDRFKLVNDTLGHEAGDMLLVQAAQRMTDCLRAGDTVARLSGDEFVILLSELTQTSDAGLVGRKVLAQLSLPFNLQGQEAFISASAGASVYPEDGLDAATLLRHADLAMYHAKDMGRNDFHYYNPEMGLRMSGLQALEQQLRGALERQEFFLLYQPKISLRHGGICGFEALLRWQHPQRGVVSPDEFISVLEETGMILLVGQWVLQSVAAQIVSWQAAGILVPRVAINMSARQFSSEQLETTVADVLRQSGVDPRLLEFELTESMLMQNPDAALAMIRKFHGQGLSFSIDDFGTGYSSLSLLNRFPLDAIKIDRSFVRDMVLNPADAAITRGIITLAHSLQLKVVAEGVETAEQLAMLTDWACDEIQGFYFSQPVTAGECAAMLGVKKRLSLPALAVPA